MLSSSVDIVGMFGLGGVIIGLKKMGSVQVGIFLTQSNHISSFLPILIQIQERGPKQFTKGAKTSWDFDF